MVSGKMMVSGKITVYTVYTLILLLYIHTYTYTRIHTRVNIPRSLEEYTTYSKAESLEDLSYNM